VHELLTKVKKKTKKSWFWLRSKNILNIFGIGLSFLMMLHSLWQLDLIAVRPVWGTGEWISWFLSTGYKNFCDMPWQCGFWFRTTLGNAYDYYLSMIVVSWFVLLISLWYWRHK